MRGVFFLLAAVSGVAVDSAVAQEAGLLRSGYVKTEQMIPMRDGTRLYTAIYAPKAADKPRPILIERTPYGCGPYGPKAMPAEAGPSPHFVKAGYILVHQDVRGTHLSEGSFVDVRPDRKDMEDPKAFDESTDAYDTVDWLVKNVPNNNGRVGIWGISYPGFYAAAALIDAHPALKAASPQAPLVDWFLGDDTHHNGALFLQQEFNFDAVFGVERPKPTTAHGANFNHGTNDAYAFFLKVGPLKRVNDLYFKGTHKFWDEVMRHGTYDDFWKERALTPRLKNVRPAVLTVGGWFDAEDLFGPLQTYQSIEKSSPNATNTLVMGPWPHGGWSHGGGSTFGPINLRSRTADHFRQNVEPAFFDRHLDGVDGKELPEALVFQTGENAWRELPAWPPRGAIPTPFWLDAGGRLSKEKPTEKGFEEFLSDPNKPVPYTSVVSIDTPPTYMVEDQRFAARRPDVLVYETEPLAEDLTVAGPIRVELVVSTTGTDADWVVKLIDAHPIGGGGGLFGRGQAVDGYQQLVRGDVMRGKFRESFERPKPFVPGEPTSVPFTLQDCFHTFKKGHRLMIQVQSSWFPLVDRNPQTFVDIYKADESDFKAATHRVHRGSRVVLPVLPAKGEGGR